MNTNDLSCYYVRGEELVENIERARCQAVEAEAKLSGLSYRLPPDYMSWNVLRVMLVKFGWAAVARESGDIHTQVTGATERYVAYNMSVMGDRLRAYDFPFFLVGSALLEELSHTDALDGLSVTSDAPLPFPAFVLLPPVGSLRLPVDLSDGSETANVVALYIAECGDRLSVLVQSVGATDGVTRLVCMSVLLDETGVIITDADEIDAVYKSRGEHVYAGAEHVVEVAKLISNVLATMAAEPELVEGSSVLSTIRKHGGKVTKRFMTPRWVGRSVKRSYTPEAGEAGGSVKPHWRRGYVRRQRHGAGRQLTKLVRIRPVRVNSQKEVEA